MGWLTNGIPPWASYRGFMSGCLVVLDKQPGVRPVDVGETWRRFFAKIVLKVTGPESTMAWHYDQLCSGLKAVIYSMVPGVQDIWDENSTIKD